MTLTEKEARLIITMLTTLQDNQSRAVCNDFRWPHDWSQEERDAFDLSFWTRQGAPGEHRPAGDYCLDWIITGELIGRLEDQLS